MATNLHPGRPARRRKFHLHCSCGATVTSSDSTLVCPECGKAVTFRGTTRVWRRAVGLIPLVVKELPLTVGWPVLIALIGYFAGIEGAILGLIASLIVLGVYRADVSSARRGTSQSKDPTMRYRLMGRLILVGAVFVALGYSVPASNYEQWMAIAKHPKPRDCEFPARPFGDKHCHYEPSFASPSNGSDGLIVSWIRESD